MDKTLHNSDDSPSTVNVPDQIRFGNPDLWVLICKASSNNEGWMKSTKAMETQGGCLVQVTTQQRNVDGTYSIAEAVTYIPGASIVLDEQGNRQLR